MVDEPDNLILAHLRHIGSIVDQTAQDVRDLKSRVGGVATTLVQTNVAVAEHSVRIDRIDERVSDPAVNRRVFDIRRTGRDDVGHQSGPGGVDPGRRD